MKTTMSIDGKSYADTWTESTSKEQPKPLFYHMGKTYIFPGWLIKFKKIILWYIQNFKIYLDYRSLYYTVTIIRFKGKGSWQIASRHL